MIVPRLVVVKLQQAKDTRRLRVGLQTGARTGYVALG